MEIVIALIIVAIVGYFIYQSLPNTKFEKAQTFFNAKDYVQAITLFNEIFEKHIDAPAKLAECKLNLGKQASAKPEKVSYFNEVVDIRKRISKSESITKFESIEANAFFEIALIQYKETKGDIDKLNQNIKFIDTANKKGCESGFSSLKKKHFYDLADSHFKKATDKEKSDKLSEAIEIYNAGKDYAEKSDNKTVKNNSATRITICQLKRNEKINLDHVSEIGNSDKSYQKELYYRYAIQLLKNKEYAEAEKIISSNLNFQSSDIDKLSEILKAEKSNNAVKKIEEINIFIEQLQKKSLPAEELKVFYNSLDETINDVKVLDKQVSEKISALKLTLFNRLLTHYIAVEQFGSAISIIQKYPKFWESPELLKNFGICCYGYTSKRLLTERNYQTVISGWLTSVYSNRVILKSLDDTTWDDNYTFTLVEAIGLNYLHHEELPDNVNYDKVSETNISIGVIQKELLEQFETIIHKEIQDPNLSKLVNDFYDKEKEAIRNIIKVIKTDIFLATPYFAASYGLNNKIIEKLDSDYHRYSSENSLEAGVPYIRSSNSSVVYQYFFTNDLVDKVVTAINNENLVAIKSLNTKDNKKWIENFNNINSSVEDKLFNTIANKILEDDKNEKLISVMEECILFSSQNAKLKHQYSNYVANYCISKVNENEMDNIKALSLMKGAYLHSPNNPKIVKNFITLIRFNLIDILNEETTATTEFYTPSPLLMNILSREQKIYTILDWVKNNMSQTYKKNSSELSKARREILLEMELAGVDVALFDYNSSYSILSRTSLNSHGLKIKKVLTYLKELGNV